MGTFFFINDEVWRILFFIGKRDKLIFVRKIKKLNSS